jgi:hypothetical protein
VGEETAMCACNAEVVGLHRYNRDDALNELRASCSASRPGEFDPNEQLGDRDRGNRNIVVVSDQLIEPKTLSLGGNENRRVEN